MNTVEPIRDMEQVKDMQAYLKKRNKRDYVMFMVQLYTALRISDVLKLKVRDVREKKYISIREQKTNKENRYLINNELKGILDKYIKNMEEYEYLFKSQKGINKPITRNRAYTILSSAAKELGIENVGTHTPRKTFGYFHFQKHKDIVTLKEIYNHSDIAITRRYIGLTQDMKDKMTMGMSFL